MRMRNILLMSLMAMLLVGLVNAVTLDLPAASGTMGDSAFNLSALNSGSFINITKAWFYASSVLTANSSTALGLSKIGEWNGNDPADDYSKINLTIPLETLLMDGRSYIITVVITNGTTNATDTSTNVIVDVTSPDCTDTTGFSSGDIIAPDATWSVTGGNTTTATIRFDGNNRQMSAGTTFTGRSKIFTFSDNIPEKIYKNVEMIVSDGIDSTSCGILKYVQIDDSTTALRGKALLVQLQQGDFVTPSSSGNSALIIILLLVAAAMTLGKKKK